MKVIDELEKIAEYDICDGNCDDAPPYKKCPECAARHVLNEIAEIATYNLRRIRQPADGYCRRVGLHYKTAFTHGFKHGVQSHKD